MEKIYIAILAFACSFSLTSCNDFLDYKPTAVVDEDKAFSDPEAMTNSAYAMLGDCWYQYPFNLWPYGDITSDDCLKGGSGVNDTAFMQPFHVATVPWLRSNNMETVSWERPRQSNVWPK